jgi:hypothetical protein
MYVPGLTDNFDKADSIKFAQTEINVYPNPTSQFITIHFPNIQDNIQNIAISNIEGKVLQNIENVKIDNYEFKVNLGSIPSGVYIIKVTYQKSIIAKKIIYNSSVRL